MFGSELQAYYPKAVVCGLVREGRAMLAPQRDVLLQLNDEVVLLGNEDSDSVVAKSPSRGRPHLTHTVSPTVRGAKVLAAAAKQPRKVMLLNWNERGSETLCELGERLGKHGRITVLCEEDQSASAAATRLQRGSSPTHFIRGSPLDSDSLQVRCTPRRLPAQSFRPVV